MPLRRESIEEHIATAKAYLRRDGVVANATRAWVRDLVREGIIDGPQSGPKAAGRGRRERFSPRDYGDLIETMRLRSGGAIHRSTWLVWHWLRGRDYPIPIVREALATDLRRNLSEIRRQFAPTGRDTEPFITKFRRNIAPQRAQSPFPDLGPLSEPLAALMFRPSEAKNVPLDLDSLVEFAAEALGLDARQFRTAIDAGYASPQTDTATALRAFSDALPESDFAALVRTFAEVVPREVKMPNLVGMLDDGFGHSNLEHALDRATDDELRRIRTIVRSIRTGQFEIEVRSAQVTVPSNGGIALNWLGNWARLQRLLLRLNPAQNAGIFCSYLAADGPPIPIELRQRLDVDLLLRALRD